MESRNSTAASLAILLTATWMLLLAANTGQAQSVPTTNNIELVTWPHSPTCGAVFILQLSDFDAPVPADEAVVQYNNVTTGDAESIVLPVSFPLSGVYSVVLNTEAVDIPNEGDGVVQCMKDDWLQFYYDQAQQPGCCCEHELLTNAALPVELTSFTATAGERRVMLAWETTSETNNAGFRIERRFSGELSYREVGFVAGAGNSTEARFYTYEVEDMEAGINVFRLKQVDFDGSFSYSAPIQVLVEAPHGFELSAAYPNPFNPSAAFHLYLEEDQAVSLTVYDALGRVVEQLHSGVLTGGVRHRFRIGSKDLTGGLYIYRAQGERFSAERAVVLLR